MSFATIHASAPHPRTIAIVGGGFSGSTVAANLLLYPPSVPTRIVLIERLPDIARGVAYAQRAFPYLLNVPAAQMSADPQQPAGFLQFAQRRRPTVTAEDFLPREWYGDYLNERLSHGVQTAPAHVSFIRVTGEAQDLTKTASGEWRIELDNGDTVAANAVVLACGNPRPRALPSADGLEDLIVDPWRDDARLESCTNILLVGTGLTMVDVALRTASLPGPKPHLFALSTHGLLPLPQTNFCRAAAAEHTGFLEMPDPSISQMCRASRRAAAGVTKKGRDWREIITSLRLAIPAIWQRASLEERRRFTRHLRSYWEIHRHRLPPEVATRIQGLIDDAALEIHAGRVVRLEREGEQVRVFWRPRGQGAVQSLLVDRVVNCTGPNFNLQRTADAFLRKLASQQLISGDALCLGLRTDLRGQVLDANGVPQSDLWYVGPMLRADHWEATAVPELRVHAMQLSERLAVQA